MMDTFIPSDNDWEQLRALSENIEAERNIVERLKLRNERIRQFYSAMHKLYSQVIEEARRRALTNDWCEDPFANAATQLQRNLQKSVSSATRNYPKNE